MKPSLQLKISQQMLLTPQLQQSIRLLQLSTLEFSQEMERYLQENPLLEREDEESPETSTEEFPVSFSSSPSETYEESAPTAFSETLDEGNWSGEEHHYADAGGSFDDDGDYQDTRAVTTSLREHLLWQLRLTKLSERDQQLVQYLIESLDDDGYLTVSLEELAEMLPAELELEPEELRIALTHLQFFDPTGVGARSAQECLALQLVTLPADETRQLALCIVNKHLDLLAARDFTRLKKILNCDDATLRDAHLLIKGLNPRPGANFSEHEARYIVPDLIVRKIRGHWTASINGDTYPRLRLNHLYAQILSKQRGSGLAGHLQEARWLLKNVQQRFDTILRVGQAIVDRQRHFFDYGEVAMKPLVLREIADVLGLHESTVSRVTTQKYMATPRGIFELKYFFGGYIVTDTGGACSATAIRAMIRQFVEGESKQTPLSDNQISEILKEQGIIVARRTVAKYRESLNIPPVKMRKTI